MDTSRGRWRGSAALAICLIAVPAGAGLYGVPTDLSSNGNPGTNSVDPPGWFNLDGLGNSFSGGDGVHQIRLFIEVTGTTLDIQVFDAFTGGARDIVSGSTVHTTTYALVNPAGTVIATLTSGPEIGGATDNRLARFTPPCGSAPNSCGFFVPNSGSSNNRDFRAANGTAISPGLYELRISTNGAGETDVNAFGVDIRVARNSTTRYNVFTLAADNGISAAPIVSGNGESAWLAGATTGGTPSGSITQPLVFYAYVDRGCTIQTSNFDMDLGGAGAGGSGTVTDPAGTSTALTMSGGTVHAENTISVESTSATNLESNNYGAFLVRNDIGTQNNGVDWRVSDFQGSTSAGPSVPVQPVNPIRMYLPNGYAGGEDDLELTPPAVPIFATSARVVSGANPLVAGSATQFTIAATVSNPTAHPLTNVQITVGHVTGQSAFSTPRGCIDGAGVSGCDSVSTATCTNGSGGSFRRCTFASIPAGSVASMLFEVTYTPPGTGLRNLTAVPAALPNTTTASAQFTPAYSSVTFPRTETLGPACNLVVNVGGAALATRATIRGLRVAPDRIEFATGSQRDTVSFDVYATDDRRGHQGLVRLNAAPVRAPIAHSLTPVSYRLDAGTTRPFIVIDELDTRGRRHRMGPFPTHDVRLRAAFERISERLASAGASFDRDGRTRLLSGRRSAALGRRDDGRRGGTRYGRSAHGVSVVVAERGTVEIALQDLAARGLPAGNPRRLRVTSQGRPVKHQLVRAPGGGVSALRFDVDPRGTDYSWTSAYVVSRDPVPAPSAPPTRSGLPVRPGWSRVERNTLYVANAPEEEDPWKWDILFGDGSAWPYGWWDPAAGDFDLPDLAPGASGRVPVSIRLLGRTSHRHDVTASINGVAVGRASFQGARAAELTGEVPAGALRPYRNQLSLQYTSEGGADGLVYLSDLELALPRGPRRIVSATLHAYDPSLPRAAGVSYLIVTHASFRAQAERLASLKEVEGLRAAVVDVDRLYDRFSGGVVEASAVREGIAHYARLSRRLRYVLLMGDDTFDARDDLGTGAIPFVPSLLCWDGEFGRVPCENRYADLDGDGRPELAMGRLPVQTAEEAERLVDKIAQQGALRGNSAHLVAVDNQAPGDLSFRAAAESMLPDLGNARVSWADAGEDLAVARQRLLEGVSGGAAVVHYFGHGGPETWADEGLLTADDVWPASPAPAPVVFTWACESQWYQYLFGRTVNEALLLAPSGGAVAAFGPAGITDPEHQAVLFRRVYPNVFRRGLTLGEAIRRAKTEALAADPQVRRVVEGWNLLGDPALRLTWSAADLPPAPVPDPDGGTGNDGSR